MATTISYFGNSYEETDYFASAPPCCDDTYQLRGAYSESQAVRIDLDLGGDLEAGMHYRLGAYPAPPAGAREISLVRAFDGINTFDAGDVHGFFRTDAAGAVVEWFFEALSGSGPDFQRMIVSNDIGAQAEYSYEYEIAAPVTRFRSFALASSGSERASAVTSKPGEWAITPVPLPAGGMFLAFAAVSLLGARRLSR